MSRTAWNTGGNFGAATRKGARSQEFSGMAFESRPKKGWDGHWTSTNGRVVLRHRRKNDQWEVLIDGKKVGSKERVIGDAVSYNDWAIRPATVTP